MTRTRSGGGTRNRLWGEHEEPNTPVEITGGPSYLRLVENDIDFGQTDATAVVGHWGKQVWIVGRLEAVVGAEIAAAVELDQD